MESKTREGRRKYSEIVDTALRLFLENGYEATSIRMIASEVGCEPGLIYYYFKSKDEAFEKAFERLFEGFSEGGSAEADCPAEPYAALYPVFRRFSTEVTRFRIEYGKQLHWTVRSVIRERALSALSGRIKAIVCRLNELGAIDPADPCAAAEFLAYGIGNAIIAGNTGEGYTAGLAGCAASVLRPGGERKQGFIPFRPTSAEGLEKLFPALLGSGGRYDLLSDRIAAREVLAIGNGERIIGAVIFSRARRSIDHLMVLREYRRLGIGTRLITAMLGEFSPGDTVSAAFLEHIAPATAFYKKLGFTESHTTAPFGNPMICMTLRIPGQGNEKE